MFRRRQVAGVTKARAQGFINYLKAPPPQLELVAFSWCCACRMRTALVAA